ncbi:MAG: transposase, partial [Kiritimatiellae bacterium]|nr:transposase [Kiritimatiellia bacterium]
PEQAIDRMQAELKALPPEKRDARKRARIQELLDQGCGACVLKNETCARIVQESLLFGHGDRYELLAWVIMPNHIHVMISETAQWPLSKVVQSWKRHTSKEIHKRHPGIGELHSAPLWQRDYWDRFIRDRQHYETALHYIENNPVAAGLVDHPADWPWGSASLHAHERGTLTRGRLLTRA